MPDNWGYWTVAAAVILLILWSTWLKYRNSDMSDIFDIWP